MSSDALRGVAIMGATGTGKSALAIRLAETFGGEIVGMDSRQVYRRLSIGTAKVGPEDLRRLPHHLIDILDPEEPHSAGRHCELVRAVAREAAERGTFVWLVGGTGFYFRALYEGLIDTGASADDMARVRKELKRRSTDSLYEELVEVDANRARELSRNDRTRIARALEIYLTTGTPPSEHAARQAPPPAWDGPRFVLTLPREELRRRIADRTRRMFAAGWVDEVEALLASGVLREAPAMNSLGYGVIADAIGRGEDPLAIVDEVITQTQQYAKRQETFFRGIGEVRWIDTSEEGAENTVGAVVSAWLGL
jgi:tRNA dimethylallyltransferase